jgi:SAM-dependent methyltransferase
MGLMTEDELRRIAASVGARRGWDFSRMRETQEPAPWDYADIVRTYLTPDSHVLDIGTGGGERFLALADAFRSGVGIDASAEMIATAQENLPPVLTDRIGFAVMPAQRLTFAPASFDVVLNRHAPVDAAEVTRVLRSGGVFLTQQVGARNTANICSIFGCTPGGTHASEPSQTPEALRAAFLEAGCRIVAEGEYDVRAWFLDVESLLFWLQAVPLPEDFAIERHWRQVDAIISGYSTERGIETNVHRTLLVARKD